MSGIWKYTYARKTPQNPKIVNAVRVQVEPEGVVQELRHDTDACRPSR